MRRFLFRFTLFLVTSFVLINLVAAVYGAFSRSRYERDGSETYDAIRRAQAPGSSANIVLGDSVCHQLLLAANLPDTLNLSCNQAVSMCGQYLLAHAAVTRDPAVKRVTLAYLPQSFANDLNEKFTFNYVVKPFYVHADLRSGMDALVRERLDRRPFYRLMLLPMFRYSDLLGATDYSGPAQTGFTYLSPVSVDYLHQLDDLCRERSIRLRVVCPPISTASGFDAAVFSREVVAAHLEDVFAGYAQTMQQVDPSVLLDGRHFKPEDIREYSQGFLKMLEEMGQAGG
jgi:hypothetical protein